MNGTAPCRPGTDQIDFKSLTSAQSGGGGVGASSWTLSWVTNSLRNNNARWGRLRAMLGSPSRKWVSWRWVFFADVVDIRKAFILISCSSPATIRHMYPNRIWFHFHFLLKALLWIPAIKIKFTHLSRVWGFPGSSVSKESTCHAGGPGFDPWVKKIPWRRKWEPTPVCLPRKIPWTEKPG